MADSYQRHLLPTPQQAIQVTELIYGLELQLEATLNLVESLRQQIVEHRAWLAPVRRLSRDCLSLIFERSAEEGWASLLDIGAVCRLWREVVLDTPAAWRYVGREPLAYPKPLGQLVPFFRRSGRCSLHVRNSSEAITSLPHDVLDRISCLWLPRQDIQPSASAIFPSLRFLAINHQRFGDGIPAAYFVQHRFPSLEVLQLYDDLTLDPNTSEDEQLAALPVVEHLRICTDDIGVYLRVIEQRSNALVSLSIGPMAQAHAADMTKVILLPRLQSLHLMEGYESYAPYSKKVVFDTPALLAYGGVTPGSLVRADWTRVTSARLDDFRQLPDFPHITEVCIHTLWQDVDTTALRVSKAFQESPELCPKLQKSVSVEEIWRL